MKRYHRRLTRSHTSPHRSPTMVTLHDTRFVECRWWNNGWTVKTVVTWRSSASMIPAPGFDSRFYHGPFFFFKSSHTNNWTIGTLVATLPGSCRCMVSAGTGWPGVRSADRLVGRAAEVNRFTGYNRFPFEPVRRTGSSCREPVFWS